MLNGLPSSRAGSHTGVYRRPQIPRPTQIQCGSEPARDGGGSVTAMLNVSSSSFPPGLNIPYTARLTTLRMSLMLKSVFLSLLVLGSSAALADTTVDVSKIYGKIQFVDSFPDYKVQVVDSFPDLKVQQVDSFPDSPGKWKTVDSFPDYKIQIVDSFPDFKIQYVDSFPGPN
jgi:hypothetical protein